MVSKLWGGLAREIRILVKEKPARLVDSEELEELEQKAKSSSNTLTTIRM